MIGKSRVVFIFIVLLLSNGCASRPVFTIEVYGTPTPFQADSDSSTATSNPEPVPSATTSPAESPMTLPTFPPKQVLPLDFSPILYGIKYDANTFFILLGGVQAGEWLIPELAAAKISGTSEYDVYPFTDEKFNVLGYAPETSPVHPGQYFIQTEVGVDQFGMVGVAHGWPVWQGRAEELSADNEIYKRVLLDWLEEAGVADPQPGTLRIFRTDLERDGTDEIFLSANNLDEYQPTPVSGEYSVLLMRKVFGNEAKTLPVVVDIVRSQDAAMIYPRTYLPANFIDLDQDGVLELVVEFHRWEEDGALIYTIKGQEITQVP